MLGLGLGSSPAWGQEDRWLGRDKALHFGVSAGLAAGGYAGAAVFTPSEPVRLASGGLLSLTLGIGKELADHRGAGDASFRDLSWDVMGTATGLLTAWLIDRYVFGDVVAARERRPRILASLARSWAPNSRSTISVPMKTTPVSASTSRVTILPSPGKK